MMNSDQIILIDQELCTSCGTCREVCPLERTEGQPRRLQSVAPEQCVRCVQCGRCVQVCSAFDSVYEESADQRARMQRERGYPEGVKEPFFAAWERNYIAEIDAALAQPDLFTTVHCDAAIFAPLAEEFGLGAGSIKPEQVVSALRKLGFQRVYSNSFAAGVAILELTAELAQRIQEGHHLPLINASCPAAVQFIEQSYPELIPHLTDCRSPRQLAGSLTKRWLAKKLHKSPEQIFTVSIASCTAYKVEAARRELRFEGHREIDAVFTTRELAWMLKRQGIDPAQMKDGHFDTEMPLVPQTEGVFCQTGDVARAVLNTLAEQDGTSVPTVDQTRTEDDILYSKVRIAGDDYTAVSISGMQNAAPILLAAIRGEAPVNFLEIMVCPQGCITGGGQPKVLLPRSRPEIYAKRAAAASAQGVGSDEKLTQNPEIRHLYNDVFSLPIGEKSNRALRVKHIERKIAHCTRQENRLC